MKSRLSPYKIGFGVLILLVISLGGFVTIQAENTKQDTQTNNAANNIANRLNNYVTSNNAIPDSLLQAGITNASLSISYRKLSSSSYKFCITYKTGSGGISGAGALASSFATGVFNVGSDSSGDNSMLFIDSAYRKGMNCQIVQPYVATITPNNTYQQYIPSSQRAVAVSKQPTDCGVSGYARTMQVLSPV